MNNFKFLNNLTGWLMFAVAATVYLLTAEPTGSLWDCGEFISAAYKMEVVHPPGAPLFLMIGRMFAFVADTFSADKANIAYALNAMSGLSTAALVLFIFWSTTILAKLSLLGHRAQVSSMGDKLAILGAGVVAALSTTFATSVWFSAVEGEVYAMSSGFTGLVIWAALRWYVTDNARSDRWLVFIAYMIGLSIGVHLLSLLVIPFIALLFYYKKSQVRETEFSSNMMYNVLAFAILVGVQFISTLPVWLHVIFALCVPAIYIYSAIQAPAAERKIWRNMGLSFAIGFAILMVMQAIFIPKLPEIAAGFDFTFVNNFGLPLGSGMIFFVLVLIGLVAAGIYYAESKKNYYLQMGVMMFAVALMGFSTYSSIVIRAAANTPINMNKPSDPYSLLSYINREQYGERPLSFGPHFAAENIGYEAGDKVYRPVEKGNGFRYEVVAEKGGYKYKKSDQMFFPRLGHMDEARKTQYRRWLHLAEGEKPDMNNNLDFFFRYQVGWMYFRYFMWNFAGRQNAKQGFYENDPTKGNWVSGIGPLDGMRLIPQSNLPESRSQDKGRNTYYLLPLIFGLIGLVFHIRRRPQDALALGVLFLVTGLAIIVFSNQPPSEPRERDYVLVGSFFTFCMWIGLAVPAIYSELKRVMGQGQAGAAVALALVVTAPIIMGFENWDDHSRAKHTGARDYATNFLMSCAPNAVIFTYGDNDTYPLWYAQEVEGIRTDVRVVNFSLLAVDWYIDQLRRTMNESPAIAMTISPAAYRGTARNALPIQASGRPMNLVDAVRFMGENHPSGQAPSYLPTDNIVIPVDKKAVRANKAVSSTVTDEQIVDQINFKINKRLVFKDEIALLDIVGTNMANGWTRPIYFAVTVRPEKLGGFKDYLQMEGMALRIVPIKTPSPNSYAGAMGMGRIELDSMYRNVVERFSWGGFDQHEMFVDESYAPSVQTTQFVMVRLARELAAAGDKERALNVLDKLFEGFPHMNFPLDEGYSRLQALEMYANLQAGDKAVPHLKDLSLTLADKMGYYAQFVAPYSLGEFAQKFGSLQQQFDAKRNQLQQMVQMMNQAPENSPQKQQLYQQAVQLNNEVGQLEAQKEALLKDTDNPEMATVFSDELSLAISQSNLVKRLAGQIGNQELLNTYNELFTPLGFEQASAGAAPAPAPQPAPEQKEEEAPESISVDS